MAVTKVLAIVPPVLLCIGVVGLYVVHLQTNQTLESNKMLDVDATVARSQTDQQSEPIQSTVFDLNETLSFLPFGSRECSKLTETLEPTFAWPKGYQETAEAHEKALGTQKGLEGHSGQLKEQQMVYVKLAQLPFVKTICETGFNAGHSALIWLTANVDAEVYSFDMGEHEYAKKMAKHLQNKYPGRLMVTWGDSTKTLPQFKRDHPEVNCDLIVVDGGHTVPVATADFSNLRNLASDTNIVVFDDYPSERSLGPRLAPVWETQVRSGTLAEQYACSINPYRGFALGHFLFLP